jgi:nitrate reductase gamma subunit
VTLSLAAVLGIGLLGWGLGPVLPFAFGVVLPLLALAVFTAGFARKILVWAAAPVPFPIALTGGQQQFLEEIPPQRLEAPPGAFWAACRLGLEILCFRSLLRNTQARKAPGLGLVQQPDPWLWLAALVFHYTLFFIILRHLRFALDPAPFWIGLLLSVDGFFQIGSPRFYMSDGGFLLALAFLLGRRLGNARLRYLSLPGDYFILLLLAGLAGPGLYLRHGAHEDLAALRSYVLSLVSLSPVAPTGAGPAFFSHLSYASSLLLCFPFGKLMHSGGILFSPTRIMPNNSRQIRHVNPWRRSLEFQIYAEYEERFLKELRAAGLPLEARPRDQSSVLSGQAGKTDVQNFRS